MTVLGQIPVEEMGVTLIHEHLLLDASSWWKRPCCAGEISLAEQPIDVSMLGDLRMNPFLNRDNCELLDAGVAIDELMQFVELGGRTVVDPTCLGIGRDPPPCRRSAAAPASTSSWVPASISSPRIPPTCAACRSTQIATAIARDCGGVADDMPMVAAGLIGEIGISKDFTAEEEKVAARRGRARRGSYRRAADRSICRDGSATAIGSSTPSRRKAATSATPSSAT